MAEIVTANSELVKWLINLRHLLVELLRAVFLMALVAAETVRFHTRVFGAY